MTVQSLLPARNSTAFMRAMEQAIAYEPRVQDSVDFIRDIKGRQFPNWLPFLLYEYGLIELTNYVPNAYTLLTEGRQWQIERDTFAAVYRGLGWISAPAVIVEAKPGRTWWNNFQLNLESIPASDRPALDRIENITTLSSPFRSDFRRGMSGYDAPAFESDASRLDGTILDNDSGVYMRSGGPKWSFGRTYEHEHTLTQAEGTALGIWLPLPTSETYSVNFSSVVDYNYSGASALRLAGFGTGLRSTAPKSLELFDQFGLRDLNSLLTVTRASKKWHVTASGTWVEFGVDVPAITDKGLLIEPAATRLCQFAPQTNALTDDDAAATVTATSVADPFGGRSAIQVTFDGNAGNTFLVPATGLVDGGTYSVSFFCKLISATGITPATADDAGFQKFYSQLVSGQWVRVIGQPFVASEIAGQWLDITLPVAGAVMVLQMHGFQIEAGSKVTSPIVGVGDTDTREADVFTLLLPSGLNSPNLIFADGSRQQIKNVVGPYVVDPASLNKSLIASIDNLASASWQDMDYPWSSAPFSWISDAREQRKIYMATALAGLSAYLQIKDEAGSVIGFRRVRAVKQVRTASAGKLLFSGEAYASNQSGNTIFVEAMTDAGNGVGQIAKSVALIFGGTLTPGIKPGALWVPAGGLTGGTAVAAQATDISLRATVRERFKVLLRF